MKFQLLLIATLFPFFAHSQNTFTISNGTTVKINGSSNIHLKNAKFQNNGTFDAGSGTVIIEGDAATNLSTIGGANPTDFYNLNINKSANDAALIQTINVLNNLTLTSGKIEIDNNNLVMGNAATFSNINKDRYIKTNGTGTLQRQIGSSFVILPIGKANFNPCRLKNDGPVDLFSVRVIDNLYLNGSSGSVVTANVVPKTWLVSEATPGGSDVTMRLIWRPIHGGSGFDANNSQITHFEGGKWNDLGMPTVANADNSFSSDHKYREATNITSFSSFGVKSVGANLPVELLYFYAEKDGNNVRLDWQTSTELNNSHFDVEWSKDGVNFNKIGEVAGAGTTNEVQFYEFLHTSPIKGQNYYRLKQVDFDSKFEYTNILNIEFQTSGIDYKIFPNPTSYYFTVEGMNSGEIVQVFNVNGQVVKEFQIQSNQHQITTDEFLSGTYFVKMGDQVKKLIIQK